VVKVNRLSYPILVGFMLGLIQTGLFFQLGATLSSGFGTYLMITLCWLIGSAIGVTFGAKYKVPISALLITALLAYGLCAGLLTLLPFQTQLWPVYALLIVVMGLYPGLFFSRMAGAYRAQTLFLLENNGFILGIVVGTLLLLLINRAALWIGPSIIAVVLFFLREPQPVLVTKPG
jgi:hypothetical protein